MKSKQKVFTFCAASASEALEKARKSLGKDAVLLHTRHRQGLFRKLTGRQICEIQACRMEDMPDQPVHRQKPAAQPVNSVVEDTSLEDLTGTYYHPRRKVQGNGSGNGAVKRTETELFKAISKQEDQINTMTTLLKQIVEKSKPSEIAGLSTELQHMYHRLIEDEVAQDLAAKLVKRINSQLTGNELDNPELIRRALRENVRKLVRTGGEIQLQEGKTRVAAFIGPTGVGKTTTIAKLAANFTLVHKSSVALITIDTYRIGATDHIHKYAELMQIPLFIANTPEELRRAIFECAGADLILVDTAGRNPHDTMKMNELRSFLSVSPIDEVHLVVSTTTDMNGIMKVAEQFSSFNYDKILMTKVDESENMSLILNVLTRLDRELSYITTGQSVPDDISVGRADDIADRLLSSAAHDKIA